MPKRATVVLCDHGGRLLGELPPVTAALPWWQEVGDVVDAVQREHGVAVTVLRLLAAAGPFPRRGTDDSVVTYMAEVDGDPPPALRPTSWVMDADPLRLPYASPGGPAADLAWAASELAAAGRPLVAARQERTWNLSAVWRLATDGGEAWLKVVPPFFAHEGALIRALTPGPVPPLIAHDRGRVLLDHIPGAVLWDASPEGQRRLVDALLTLQWRHLGDVDALLPLGLPDWRAPGFIAAADRLPDLAFPADRPGVVALVAGLPARFEALEACGLPDTLVHGDCHVGNGLADGDGPVTILDWGDAGVGHPLLDLPALVRNVASADGERLRTYLLDRWRERCAGADVERAAALVAPLAQLREAMIYDGFVRNIEATERVYHEGDAARSLAAAVRSAL
jgi:hypothetical protein